MHVRMSGIGCSSGENRGENHEFLYHGRNTSIAIFQGCVLSKAVYFNW